MATRQPITETKLTDDQKAAVANASTRGFNRILNGPGRLGDDPLVIAHDSGYIGFARSGRVTVSAPEPLSESQTREALEELRRHIGPAECDRNQHFTSRYTSVVAPRVSVDTTHPTALGYGPEDFSAEGC